MDNVPKYFHENEVHHFARYIDAHEAFYLVYLDHGTIMGGSGWEYDLAGATGSITWVFCRPEAQGKGIGRKLVKGCLRELRTQPNLKRVFVRTSQLACNFFAKFGFKVISTESDYWGPGLDLVLMEMHPA